MPTVLKNTECEDWEAMDRAMKYFLSKVIEARCQLLHNDKLPRHNQPHKGIVPLARRPTEQTPFIEAIKLCTKLEMAGWTVTFLTFNYDLVLESILGNLGVATNYCLPEAPPNLDRTGPQEMKVLKLHGSINWQMKTRPNRTPEITPFSIFPFDGHCTPDRDYYDVSQDHQVTSKFSEAMNDPVIVPPVWNKSNYHAPIKAIWREAAVSLSRASHIYCLGYSLPQTDGFFKQLFALGTIGDRPLQQFRVFDKEREDNPGGVHSRYRSMLGRGSENVFGYSSDGAEGLLETLAALR